MGKKTSLNKLHQDNHAKFVEFAGYEMPIQYSKGIVEEHKFTRSNAGIFDVSHMGQLFIHGGEDLTADLEKIFDIPPDAFYPVPKVNSTLVKITPNRKKYNLTEYNKLKAILSACFANPRKQLASPLKKIFPSMPSFSFSLTNRPEDLALDHYFEILSKYEK